MGGSSRTRRARLAGTITAWTSGAVLALAVLATAWVGVRGFLAYGHLADIQTRASSLTAELADPAQASSSIEALSADAAAAADLTSDPVWHLYEQLPWIGPQLGAVATIAAAADEVTSTALRPLAEVASSFSLDALRPRDGAIDLAAIGAIEPAAREGAAGIARALSAIEAIEPSTLLPPVREPLADVEALLRDAGDSTDALARATALMPAMLGGDGPRSYLVVFQNNAEWRSLGGIVGAMAQVTTEGGRMSLTAQASSSDFPRYDEPVIDLGEDVLGIQGTRPARYIQNATQVADFAVGAQIAREMWARQSGTQVDGVLSVDPVALSYLLQATGPIALPTGDVLTSENAVSLLLNEVYLRYERPADQDAFFEAAAASVFAAVASGGADPALLVEALSRAGDEDRLLLWNADPGEQAVLDGTTLQGALPETDAQRTSFGVYLNDGTGSKMDYYLRADAGTAWCGSGEAALVFRVRSDAPQDAASLPDYITGGGGSGLPPGTALTVSWIYLPVGSELVSATATRGGQVVSAGTDGEHPVLTWASDLAPGDDAVVTVRVRTPVTPSLGARLTPNVYNSETLRIGANCEFAG